VASLPSAAKSASSSARCAAGVPREGQCAGRGSQARKSEAAAQKAPQAPVPASTRAKARDGSASERTCALISSSMLGCTATLLILSASSAGLRRRLPDYVPAASACQGACPGLLGRAGAHVVVRADAACTATAVGCCHAALPLTVGPPGAVA
jgi:hypothetical protein